MAERSKRSCSKMDYSSLNTLSTLDIEEPLNIKRRKIRPKSRLYGVERIISRRQTKDGNEYLIQWKGWPVHESTWEPSDHLTDELISSYSNPNIPVTRLQDAATNFVDAILSVLKSKALKVIHSAEVHLPHDIVRYVFRGKGVPSADKKYMLYEKDDFSRFHLPPYWSYYLNEQGQGVAVKFPIKLKCILSKSKKRYIVDNGKVILAPSTPLEKVMVIINRRACDTTNIFQTT